jgi:hypothetical protein
MGHEPACAIRGHCLGIETGVLGCIRRKDRLGFSCRHDHLPGLSKTIATRFGPHHSNCNGRAGRGGRWGCRIGARRPGRQPRYGWLESPLPCPPPARARRTPPSARPVRARRPGAPCSAGGRRAVVRSGPLRCAHAGGLWLPGAGHGERPLPHAWRRQHRTAHRGRACQAPCRAHDTWWLWSGDAGGAAVLGCLRRRDAGADG